jgi:hypothetical protein
MDDANYYEGRVLNVYNSDWDEDTIYTNSLYLYEDHILIRTYDHTRGEWLPAFDRTVTPAGMVLPHGVRGVYTCIEVYAIMCRPVLGIVCSIEFIVCRRLL